MKRIMLTQPQLKKMIGEKPTRNLLYIYYYFELYSQKKESFNWAAAFLWPFWMPYRNLYFISLLFGLVFSLLNMLFPIEFTSFLFFLYFGFWGNKLYFQFLEDMQKADYQHIKPNSRSIIVSIVSAITFLTAYFIGKYLSFRGSFPNTWTTEQIVEGLAQKIAELPIMYHLMDSVIASVFFLVMLFIFGGERRKDVFFYPFFRK